MKPTLPFDIFYILDAHLATFDFKSPHHKSQLNLRLLNKNLHDNLPKLNKLNVSDVANFEKLYNEKRWKIINTNRGCLLKSSIGVIKSQHHQAFVCRYNMIHNHATIGCFCFLQPNTVLAAKIAILASFVAISLMLPYGCLCFGKKLLQLSDKEFFEAFCASFLGVSCSISLGYWLRFLHRLYDRLKDIKLALLDSAIRSLIIQS